MPAEKQVLSVLVMVHPVHKRRTDDVCFCVDMHELAAMPCYAMSACVAVWHRLYSKLNGLHLLRLVVKHYRRSTSSCCCAACAGCCHNRVALQVEPLSLQADARYNIQKVVRNRLR